MGKIVELPITDEISDLFAAIQELQLRLIQRTENPSIHLLKFRYTQDYESRKEESNWEKENQLFSMIGDIVEKNIQDISECHAFLRCLESSLSLTEIHTDLSFIDGQVDGGRSIRLSFQDEQLQMVQLVVHHKNYHLGKYNVSWKRTITFITSPNPIKIQ